MWHSFFLLWAHTSMAFLYTDILNQLSMLLYRIKGAPVQSWPRCNPLTRQRALQRVKRLALAKFEPRTKKKVSSELSPPRFSFAFGQRADTLQLFMFAPGAQIGNRCLPVLLGIVQVYSLSHRIFIYAWSIKYRLKNNYTDCD